MADGKRIVTIYGHKYNLDLWPYGTLRPWYIINDEQYLESLIDDGFFTARLLYLRGIYTVYEMEEHMNRTIDMPLFGCLCPHRVLPDNCSKCCGRESGWWMRP